MIWRAIAAICTAALGFAVLPLLGHFRETPPPSPPAVRLSLPAPPGTELGAGDEVLDAAMSPDGREMVFVATVNGVTQLWRRGFDSEAAEALNDTVGAALPAWKATGRIVSFFAGGTLKQLSRADGSVRDLIDAPSPAGASWLPDGSVLFATGTGPIRRLQNGVATDASVLKPGDQRHAFPEAAGDLGFLYVATLDSGRQVVRLVSGGMERDLTTTSSHAQLVDGHLVLVRDNTLVMQVLDATAQTLTGRSTPLAFNVGVSLTGHGFFAASPRLLAWAAAAPRMRQLAWSDTRGGTVTRVGEPADYWQVRLSPNDTEAALTIRDPLLRTLDVFVLPLTAVGFAPRRLSTALAADSDPVWSPRGDRVVYRSLQGGQPNLFARGIDESGTKEELVLRSELDETPTDWRGRMILFHAPGRAGDLDVWSVDETGGTPAALIHTGFSDSDARWSPDGRLLAYVSDESGQRDIYVERGPGAANGVRARVSRAGGIRPEWGADGRSLFFLRDGRVMRADLAGGPSTTPLQFTAPREAVDQADVRDYSVAHRSDRVLMIVPVGRSRPPTAGVIVNWTSDRAP